MADTTTSETTKRDELPVRRITLDTDLYKTGKGDAPTEEARQSLIRLRRGLRNVDGIKDADFALRHIDLKLFPYAIADSDSQEKLNESVKHVLGMTRLQPDMFPGFDTSATLNFSIIDPSVGTSPADDANVETVSRTYRFSHPLYTAVDGEGNPSPEIREAIDELVRRIGMFDGGVSLYRAAFDGTTLELLCRAERMTSDEAWASIEDQLVNVCKTMWTEGVLFADHGDAQLTIERVTPPSNDPTGDQSAVAPSSTPESTVRPVLTDAELQQPITPEEVYKLYVFCGDALALEHELRFAMACAGLSADSLNRLLGRLTEARKSYSSDRSDVKAFLDCAVAMRLVARALTNFMVLDGYVPEDSLFQRCMHHQYSLVAPTPSTAD